MTNLQFLPSILESNETSATSWGSDAILCLTISSAEAILHSKSWIALINSSGSGGSPAGVRGLKCTWVSSLPSTYWKKKLYN